MSSCHLDAQKVSVSFVPNLVIPLLLSRPETGSRILFSRPQSRSHLVFSPCPSLFTEPLVVTSRALVVCNFYRYGERCVLTGGSPVSLSVLSLLLLFLWPDTGYTALFCGPAVKSAVTGVPCKPPPPPHAADMGVFTR